jgi:L-ascorbate metabolism protein UlaG (beta-lactamase superfamily)
MQTIQVAGGNLFRVAMTYLGDATQWVRIAQLNGLSDPMLSGTVTLRIPPVDPGAGGGIAAQ